MSRGHMTTATRLPRLTWAARRTFPSSNSAWQNQAELTARFVLGANLSLVDVFAFQPTKTDGWHETGAGQALRLALSLTKHLLCQLEILGCFPKSILNRRHLFFQRQGNSLFG